MIVFFVISFTDKFVPLGRGKDSERRHPSVAMERIAHAINGRGEVWSGVEWRGETTQIYRLDTHSTLKTGLSLSRNGILYACQMASPTHNQSYNRVTHGIGEWLICAAVQPQP